MDAGSIRLDIVESLGRAFIQQWTSIDRRRKRMEPAGGSRYYSNNILKKKLTRPKSVNIKDCRLIIINLCKEFIFKIILPANLVLLYVVTYIYTQVE